MDAETFAVEAEIEQDHWWFRGRRALFRAEIARLDLPRDAAILDVGTSTGTNLRLLRDMGHVGVRALDSSQIAIDYVLQKGLGSVTNGDICAMPYPDNSFDLVLATDVIEHVDDDAGALREIRRVLRPGGHVIVTVPAFQSLWGLQDRVAHHKRRYRMAGLSDRIAGANLTIERKYYFNYLLFPAIWAARRLLDLSKSNIQSENQINTTWLNAILGAIFRFDVATAPLLRLPFGVSALVRAKKG